MVLIRGRLWTEILTSKEISMAQDRLLLAVLIDADNIPARHAAAILKEITRYGEPALRRVYGDWSSDALNNWRKQVKELGLVARQESANTTGKNASDIGLVIDAMDIVHTKQMDGFVLVSSDSDFTALANRLREDGLEVIGIGEAKAPVSLRNVCNRFLLIENITEPETESLAQDKSKPKAVTKETKKEPPSKVVPMVIKAMKGSDPDADWYQLGVIGTLINRANPDFDPRSYGSAKLSDLLEKTKQFDLERRDGHIVVRRKAT